MSDFDGAMTSLVKAVVSRMGGDPNDLSGVSVHINRGDSEDYMRGFNQGYDDYPEVDAPDDRNVPAQEPWAGAYRRGWEDGFATAREHDTEDEDDCFYD